MQNLVKVFEQATTEDMKMAARSWYTYHELTRRVAAKFGFPAATGAAVFAALSPNNDYHGNLRDTHRLLAAAHRGLAVEDFGVSTFHHNKRKAWSIVHGADPLALIIAKKTRSFYLNICDPEDPQPVTVDGHIFNAWRGQRVALKAADSRVSNRLYEVVAEDVREIGRRHGLVPNVVQGAIWHTWRRLHGIKYTPQLELWCPETLSAGLGYTSNAGQPRATHPASAASFQKPRQPA